MPFARASSLDRLLACAGGSVLGGIDVKPESTKIAADWGTMVHHWKSTGLIQAVNGRENLVPLFEKKLREGGVTREQWWPEDFEHEVPVAVSPFSRYLSYCGDEPDAWKAARPDEYCTGTADGYSFMFDVLWVDDLKTGRFVELEGHIQQLRFYALAVARHLDYRGPVHATLTHWPRYVVKNQPVRIGRVIEQDELLAFEKALAKLRDDILRARENPKAIELVAGPQCSWCISRGVCPERAKGERDEQLRY